MGSTQYEKMLLKIQCVNIKYIILNILNKIVTKFKKISSIFFLQLSINDTKTVSHEYIPSKKLEKPYRIFKVLSSFTEK